MTRRTFITEQSDDVSIGSRIVMAVADTLGIEPLDMEPLYETVDPDALESIVDSTKQVDGSGLGITFELEGCTVEVEGSGAIEVTTPDEKPTGGISGQFNSMTNEADLTSD